VKDILAESVRRATGLPHAVPRPGQAALIEDVQQALQGGEGVVGLAPTGVGKSLVLLSAAFDAACRGERTWISTESIALQEQIGHKDAPVVAEATSAVRGGQAPSFATLKGFSNYLCPLRVADAGGDEVTEAVTSWAGTLTPGLEGDAGDLHSCPVSGADAVWHKVSTSSAACLGEEKCPRAQECFALNARRRAGRADVVIGNHSFLAVQAATGSPAALGNQGLGWFENVMVDEAHQLTDAVRSHGSVRIGPGPILALNGRISSLLEGKSKGHLLSEGARCARRVGAELSYQMNRDAPKDAYLAIPQRVDPLSTSGPDLEDWCKAVSKAAKAQADKARGAASVPLLALADSAGAMAAGMRSMSEPAVGTARWIEATDAGPEVVSSPVDVSSLLATRIWRTRAQQDPSEPYVSPAQRELVDLGRVAVSGTMPRSFPRQVGLNVKMTEYPSPFDEAYDGSLLLIPRLNRAEREQISADSGKLDLQLHQKWALETTLDLVHACGGRALVLTSSAAVGRQWAKALAEASDGWNVLSQWEGTGVREVVSRWRQDTSSALVGTRSLMTGVDGPGDTCRLVVLNRVPRAAPNPLDDARTEALMASTKMARFTAMNHTYVEDAASRLEQAAGRLVRSESDRGLFACLDPRLDSRSEWAYAPATRKIYEHSLRRFTRRTESVEEALDYLESI